MKTYYVYVHHVIDADLYYVGQTCQEPKKRFKNSAYSKECSLSKYLNFNIPFSKNTNIETSIPLKNLERDEARYKEDELIRFYRSLNKCINTNRSGLICCKNPSKYRSELRRSDQSHIDRVRELNRMYYASNPEKFRERKRNERVKNPEKFREYDRKRSVERNKRIEEKIYHRVYIHNRNHPDQIKETPLEAKQRYLSEGYIPDYINSSDLQV